MIDSHAGLSAGGGSITVQPQQPDERTSHGEVDDGTQKPTERSEGGSDKRKNRPTLYPAQLVLRLDAETLADLEQHAKQNNRTVAQTARQWLWKGRDVDT